MLTIFIMRLNKYYPEVSAGLHTIKRMFMHPNITEDGRKYALLRSRIDGPIAAGTYGPLLCT